MQSAGYITDWNCIDISFHQRLFPTSLKSLLTPDYSRINIGAVSQFTLMARTEKGSKPGTSFELEEVDILRSISLLTFTISMQRRFS